MLSIALARLGAVQNPIIHLYREREVGFALRQTGAELFVIPSTWRDTDFVAIAEGALAGDADRPTILTTHDGLPEGDPAVLPPPPEGTTAEDAPIRWIYYTSGSTADPKGVQHTDQTLIAGGWGLARALDMGPDDVGSIAFPFAHIAGPDYLVTMLSMGFPAILVEAFSAPDVLPVFRRHGATMVGGSTAFYVAYLGEQRKTPDEPILPTLRLMSGGGAAKPPEVHYEVRDEIGGRGVVHGYGMTEVPMIANGSPHDTDEQLANTDGKPVEGADVRIVTLDGRPAAPDEEGEVRVKGPMVFHGYTDPALERRGLRRGRLLPHRRPGPAAGRRAPEPDRSAQGRDRPQGGEHQRQGDRGPALHPPRRWSRSRSSGCPTPSGASGSAPSCSWPRDPAGSSWPTWSRSAARPGS